MNSSTVSEETRRSAAPESSQPLVELRKVSKTYWRGSEAVHALQDINLNIDQGDFIGLMGPSGSGKSTLLNILAGIDRPTEGEVVLLGDDLMSFSEGELARWRNQHVGFVFQHFNLIPVLTAFENVELPLLLTSLSKKERKEHVLTALNLVNMNDRARHYPRQLSGGQEQRVSIARAIVTDPSFILADEPTGDLDAESATEVLDVLAGLNEQFDKTIIMVTHDPRAAEYASHKYFLDKGIMKG